MIMGLSMLDNAPDNVFLNPHVCPESLNLMPQAIKIFLLEKKRRQRRFQNSQNDTRAYLWVRVVGEEHSQCRVVNLLSPLDIPGKKVVRHPSEKSVGYPSRLPSIRSNSDSFFS